MAIGLAASAVGEPSAAAQTKLKERSSPLNAIAAHPFGPIPGRMNTALHHTLTDDLWQAPAFCRLTSEFRE
jgi:hypothetical protein